MPWPTIISNFLRHLAHFIYLEPSLFDPKYSLLDFNGTPTIFATGVVKYQLVCEALVMLCHLLILNLCGTDCLPSAVHCSSCSAIVVAIPTAGHNFTKHKQIA